MKGLGASFSFWMNKISSVVNAVNAGGHLLHLVVCFASGYLSHLVAVCFLHAFWTGSIGWRIPHFAVTIKSQTNWLKRDLRAHQFPSVE